MFKRILVAVDGSSTADRGLGTAVSLAADQGATLYAVHVVDQGALAIGAAGLEYTLPEYTKTVSEDLRKNGEKILARAEAFGRKKHQSVVPVLVESRGASIATAVVAQARKLKADLIVMGTHGRRGLQRLVMGSDAEAILHDAHVPVLLVRAPAGRSPSTGRRKSSTKRA